VELCSSVSATFLHPDEARGTERWAPKRIREFTAGRLCARAALARLGIYNFPLLRRPDGLPIWPSGVAGSITHTQGYCAAAVSKKGRLLSLGIDTEAIAAVRPELWPHFLISTERQRLALPSSVHENAVAALTFSAKESFYKCQFPITGEWLDFSDVMIEVNSSDDARGTFHVLPQRNCRIADFKLEAITGAYRFHEGFVTTAVTLMQRV